MLIKEYLIKTKNDINMYSPILFLTEYTILTILYYIILYYINDFDEILHLI